MRLIINESRGLESAVRSFWSRLLRWLSVLVELIVFGVGVDQRVDGKSMPG